MELEQLRKHLHRLVTLEATESPVISLYLNLEQGENCYRPFLAEQVKAIRKDQTLSLHASLCASMHQIQAYLSACLPSTSKGVAIFARQGRDDIFLPLAFDVALPNAFLVSRLPHVFPLFELRDNYNRYMAMIFRDTTARVLEVSLGGIINTVCSKVPSLNAQLDRSESTQQFQRSISAFIKDQVHVLDTLVAGKGHAQVLLGGESSFTEQFWRALPPHLEKKTTRIDIPRHIRSDQEILEVTNHAFAEIEERQSCAAADRLAHTSQAGGLAVIGAESTLYALGLHMAEMLVMTSSYDSSVSTKNHLVRLAERSGCQVEIARRSEALDRLGGVGCVLRYKMTA